MDQRALARPGHAGHGHQHAERDVHVDVPQVVGIGTPHLQDARRGPHHRFQGGPVVQVAPGQRAARPQPVDRALEHDPATGGAGTGPEVHHVIGDRDRLRLDVTEFRRSDDAYLTETLAGLKPAPDPLVRYEIFEVHFADAIDATVFEFKPGAVDWSDETTLVFEKLSAQQAVAAARVADKTPPPSTANPSAAVR